MIIKLYEAFNTYKKKTKDLQEVKSTILAVATDTYNLDVIDFFLKKGYDINTPDAIYNATFDNETFKYFLGKNINMELFETDSDLEKRLNDVEVQKILIDFDHEFLIYSTVGFNRELRNDPKYENIIKRVEDMAKYNL